LTPLLDIAWFVVVLGIGVGYFTLSALVHELGHWIAGRLVGVACKLEWQRSGGLVVLTTRFVTSCSMTPPQNVLVTSGGVVLQLLVNLVILVDSGHPVLRGLAVIALPLIGVNVAPVEPTDGYHLLRMIGRLRGSTARMTVIFGFSQWSLFAAALMVTSWYSIVTLIGLWNVRDGATAGIGVLGVAMTVRVLRRVHVLSRYPSTS